MKCLSLWQPWSSLLVHGLKRVETRGWALRHRGSLLIHAAKKWDGELACLCAIEPFRTALTACRVEFEATEAACKRGWNLPFGAVVGRVDVVACYPTEKVVVNDDAPFVHQPGEWVAISSTEREFGDYSGGRFALLCSNPVAFKTPVPYRGVQGLFEVPDNLIRE